MAENKKKPAVTQAEIKKRDNNGATGAKTGNRQAGNTGGRSGASGAKSSGAGGKSSATGAKSGSAAGRNQAVANKSGTKSATKSGSRSGSRPNNNQPAKRGNAGRQPQRNKRPAELHKKGPVSTTVVIIGSVVVGIVLAIIVTLIMRASLLGITETGQEYVMGTSFTVSAYVTANNEKATISYDKSEFNPEEPGEYEITVTVSSGRLSSKKKVTINVVDDDSPIISGNDSISFLVGDEINWADYYTVTDAQPDLAEQITASPAVDTSEEGTYEVTLQVIDWAEHISTKDITVTVYDLGEEMRQAIQASRQYKADYGLYPDSSGVYVYEAEDDADGAVVYALVSSQTMYKVFDDGSAVFYDVDNEDEAAVTAARELYAEIKESGTLISYSAILDFLG